MFVVYVGLALVVLKLIDGRRNDQRNRPSWNFNLKLEKELTVGQRSTVQISAEIFNLLGDKTYTIYNVFDGYGAQRNGRNDAYLTTARKYKDFVLDLEFKINKGGNSGVYLRVGNPKDQVGSGFEIQILDTHGKKDPGAHDCGGVIGAAAPLKNMAKPAGEWNRYVITCQGSRITVEMNGELVSEADLEQWKDAHQNPDGSENKFSRPLKDFARAGYIGLQDHGSWVAYRNIRIKELKK